MFVSCQKETARQVSKGRETTLWFWKVRKRREKKFIFTFPIISFTAAFFFSCCMRVEIQSSQSSSFFFLECMKEVKNHYERRKRFSFFHFSILFLTSRNESICGDTAPSWLLILPLSLKANWSKLVWSGKRGEIDVPVSSNQERGDNEYNCGRDRTQRPR